MDINGIIPIFIEYGTKIVVAILIIYIGLKVIHKGVLTLEKALNKKKFDKTLTTFLMSIIENIVKVLLVLSVIQYLGIPATSFIAILTAVGLAVGMALSGTLQNISAGIMIVIFRPFKIGDFVELAGHSGTIEEIHIFNTILKTGDNKKIIIPNSEYSTSSIVNYSGHEERRVDLIIGIGYDDDIDKARKTIEEIVDKNEKIIRKEEKLIAVSNLGESSVDLTVRVWTKTSDYWGVYFETLETIKKTFDKKQISFPYPQRDVHLFSENKK